MKEEGEKKISEISKKFGGKNVRRIGASESGDGSAGGGGKGTASLLSALAGYARRTCNARNLL